MTPLRQSWEHLLFKIGIAVLLLAVLNAFLPYYFSEIDLEKSYIVLAAINIMTLLAVIAASSRYLRTNPIRWPRMVIVTVLSLVWVAFFIGSLSRGFGVIDSIWTDWLFGGSHQVKPTPYQ